LISSCHVKGYCGSIGLAKILLQYYDIVTSGGIG